MQMMRCALWVLCVLASVAAAASEGQLVKLKHAPGGKLVVPSGANGVHPLLSQVRRKPDQSRSRLCGVHIPLSHQRVSLSSPPATVGVKRRCARVQGRKELPTEYSRTPVCGSGEPRLVSSSSDSLHCRKQLPTHARRRAHRLRCSSSYRVHGWTRR